MDLTKTKDNDKIHKNDANILLKEECPLGAFFRESDSKSV